MPDPATPPAENNPPETPPPNDDDKGLDPAALQADLIKKNAEAKSLRDQLREAQSKLDKLESETASEHDKAIKAAVKEATENLQAEFRTKLLAERVKAKAAAKVNDPEDVLGLLDLSELDPDDESGLEASIDALLEAKPYLAKTDAPAPRRTIDQGPRGKVEGNENQEATADDWLRGAIAAKRGTPPV